MSTFPSAWLSLLQTHSSLGQDAESVIKNIEQKVAVQEGTGAEVYPALADRYRALSEVSPQDCVAIIVGQDPYHQTVTLKDGSEIPQATGLSFSVPSVAKLPPSLRNIFKELSADLSVPVPVSGDISHWSQQKVLMLNAVLTVERDSPKAHDKFGWQTLTSAIFEALSRSRPGLVFVLWGNSAKALRTHIVDNDHTIIESSHPSPIGGSCNKGFFGSKPFSRVNEALRRQNRKPIEWVR